MVSHHAFDLVELGQVRGVQRLVAEHAIDGKVLDWREGLLGAQQVGMGTPEGCKPLLGGPALPVPPAAPSVPAGRGRVRWPLWCVCAARSSGLRPGASCTCTLEGK